MRFDSCNHPLKIWKSIMTPTPKMRAHLGVWGVHSLTLSYTPGSMKCDSQASLLARTFVSPYLIRKPLPWLQILTLVMSPRLGLRHYHLKCTQMQMTSLSMGCSCKMDTQLFFKTRSCLEHKYDGQFVKRSYMSSCVA